MPQANNLVLKNAAGTDKTFTLISPSAGDNSIAVNKLKEGPIAALFPSVTTSTRSTGNGKRKATLKLRIVAYTVDPVTSKVYDQGVYEFNGEATCSDTFPVAQMPDAVAYTKNLVNNPEIVAMMTDMAPRT